MTNLDFNIDQQVLGLHNNEFLCGLCGFSKHIDESSKLVFNVSYDQKSTIRLCRECSKKVLLKINAVFLGFEDDI